MKKTLIPLSILLLIILIIVVYINRFTIVTTIKVDGYAINSKTLTYNLLNGVDEASEKATFNNVSMQDTLYKSGSKYYVGEKEKTNIDISYPIVSTDLTTIFILTDTGKIIDEKFNKTETFMDTLITNLHLYNGNNFVQLDPDDYYFVEYSNNIYVNLDSLYIVSEGKENKILSNSFLNFGSDYIRLYYLDNGELIYKEFPYITENTLIRIGKYEGSYKDFYSKINASTVIKIDDYDDSDNPFEDDSLNGNGSDKTNLDVTYQQEDFSDLWGEKEYIKPEVSISNVYTKTYSFRGNLSIYDPALVITKSPTFTFKIGDTIFLRKTFNQSGDIIVEGLKPSTTYQVEASYIFYNRKGQKVEYTFYSGEVTTDSIDKLEEINIDYKDILTTSNNFKIEQLHYNNQIDDEVLNGIKKVEIHYGSLASSLSVQNVRKLNSLTMVDFESANVLKSNTQYDGEIIIFDVADNILKVNNATFTFITKKALPLATIDVEANKNFTTATLIFDINNVDDVNVLKYHYAVFDADGKEVTTSEIQEDTDKRDINNLNSGEKYYVYLYCDYIDDDGVSYQNVVIASTEFVSFDVSRLGKIYLDINYGDVTSSSQNTTIAYKTSDETFNILYEMLEDDVTLNIINNVTNEIQYSINCDKKDFRGLGSNFLLENLISNTIYRIELEFVVKNGDKDVLINVDYGNSNFFKTLKEDPRFYVENLFIASGYIDFDAIIYDKDEAIIFADNESKVVTLDVYDKESNRVYSKSLSLTVGNLTEENTKVVNRITIDNLSPNGEYTFQVTAKNYNNGNSSKSNYIIENSRTYVLSGMEARLSLNRLIKTSYYDVLRGSASGKNLFDISNRSRWKSSGDSTTNEMLTLDIDNNVVSVAAKNGLRRYNYYIPEINQSSGDKSVTISFDAKRNTGTSTTFCLINGSSGNCNSNTAKNITNVTDKYQHYEFTFDTMASDGYLTFYVGEVINKNNTTQFDLKNLEIVIGESANSSYKSFDNDGKYVGLFEVSLDEPDDIDSIIRQIIDEDEELDNINSGQYDVYVRIDCNGEKCNSEDNTFIMTKLNYNELPYSENEEVNDILTDTEYTGYISVYDSTEGIERYYDISKIDFTSETEIRTISTPGDFFGMHTNGNYIANNDIDLRGVCKTYSNTFQGSIDFQGHKLYIDNCVSYIMSSLGGSGEFKNVDIVYDLEGPRDSLGNDYYGLFYNLHGKLSNFKVTLISMPDAPQYYVSLICCSNFGTIENFAVNLKVPLIGSEGISFGPHYHYGIIKNGYVYGENIDSKYSNNTAQNDFRKKNAGVFAAESNAGSVIKNVYSLVDVLINENPTNNDKFVGNISGSISNATVKNVLYFNVSDNELRDKKKDIMFGTVSNLTKSNLYYVSSNSYSNAYSNQILAKSFNDSLFLDNILNEEGMFDTAEAFRLKIFPHVKWPDCMPTQDYLIIPSQVTTEELSLISVDKVEYLENDSLYTANALLTFHNENLVRITGLEIEGIDKIDIIDQAHNRNGKSTLLSIKIGYPSVYKSQYNLKTIKTNILDVTSSGKIDIDLYYPIENLQEIADNLSKHENFMLTKDIDCLKESCPTSKLGTIKGKINGNNHTIKNFGTNGCYIDTLNGTLENITFEKYRVNGNPNNSGLICTMKNATVSNVLMINEKLTVGYSSSSNKNIYAGGIAATAQNSTIENSGINGIELIDNELGGSLLMFGGMVANSSYLIVENSFVRNIDFEIKKDVDNISQSGGSSTNNSNGIGGIVGTLSYGNISNAYATGKIDTDMGSVGGIAGINSNGYIDSVMANVLITASQDEVGEINGRTLSNSNPKRENSITKSIAIGSINILLEEPKLFGRTSGSVISYNGVFAWDKQGINSKVSQNSDGEILLSTEDLSNSIIYSSRVGFNPKFFALSSDFVPGYMPYLLSKSGEILKGQGYNTQESIEDRRILYVEALKLIDAEFNYAYMEGKENASNKEYYATHAVATLKLNNPNYYTITNIDIPGMTVSNLRATTNSDGVTTLNFDAVPVRYFDSYNLSKISYTSGTNEEAIYPYIIIDLKFYGRIKNIDDWNNIPKGLLENYVIDSDVDFLSNNNCNYGISFNKLIGIPTDGVNPVLKNIGTHTSPLSLPSAGDSLIDTISSDIRNLSFENIYIYNRSSSGNYTGIIKFLNGTGDTLSFQNIEILAPKNSYVGIISYNQSTDLRNVTIDNLNLSGISFVGGLIGRSLSRDVTNVNISDVTINATGDYVGGLIGYEAWDSKIHTFQVTADNINVTNKANKTYIGGLFGYGSGNVISISNSYVEGYNRVGGISGQDGNSSIQYNFIKNTTVIGRGSYIGLAAGINTTRYYTYVQDSTLHCNSSLTGSCNTSYVGGISGGGSWYTILYSGVLNSTIVGGNSVGGIKGYMGGNVYLRGNYVKDTTVTGATHVGGIAGRTAGNNNYIYLNMTNATVKATSTNAGGIIGYVYNQYETASVYRTYIYRNIVANSNVTAANYAGGMIGRVDIELYSGRYYSNVLSSNVKCENNNCTANYVVGNTDDYATKITNLKLYRYNTLKVGNNNSIQLANATNVPSYLLGSNVLVSKDDLSNFTMYRNLSFSTDYFEAVSNMFPRVKSINNSYGNYKVDFPLPEENMVTGLMMMRRFHLMPEVDVYAVDIDKINVEFSFIDESTNFEINGKTYAVTQKTFTFYYNFLEDFTIILKDGVSTREILVNHEELKNKILIDGDNYYILDDAGNIISNNQINYGDISNINSYNNYKIQRLGMNFIDNNVNNFSEKAVNVYDGKILLENGNLYDIENDKVILNYVENLTIVETKPLYEYNYANQKVQTFNNYSMVDGRYIPKRIIIRDGQLEIISNELTVPTSNILSSTYNGKNYLVYLDDAGIIHSVKERIVYPKNFVNYGISSISFNKQKQDSLLFVKYKNNNYVLFNYQTGEIVEEDKSYVPSLFEYVKDLFNSNSIKEDSSKYNDAKELLKTISENGFDYSKNNSGLTIYENSKYTIEYNPISETYDIYQLPSSTSKQSDIVNIVSNDSLSKQILNDSQLTKLYNVSKATNYNTLSSFLIAVVTFILIGLLVLMLWRNLKKS